MLKMVADFGERPRIRLERGMGIGVVIHEIAAQMSVPRWRSAASGVNPARVGFAASVSIAVLCSSGLRSSIGSISVQGTIDHPGAKRGCVQETIGTHLAVALAPLEKKLVVHPSRRSEMERAMMVGNV